MAATEKNIFIDSLNIFGESDCGASFLHIPLLPIFLIIFFFSSIFNLFGKLGWKRMPPGGILLTLFVSIYELVLIILFSPSAWIGPYNSFSAHQLELVLIILFSPSAWIGPYNSFQPISLFLLMNHESRSNYLLSFILYFFKKSILV